MIRSLVSLVYLAVGLYVAKTHGYFAINDLGNLVSAVVAVALWPLVLLGIDLHIGSLKGQGKRR